VLFPAPSTPLKLITTDSAISIRLPIVSARGPTYVVIPTPALPPPKDRAGVVYDHSRRRTAKRLAAVEALVRRIEKEARKRAR
jgi:hypothetical protein